MSDVTDSFTAETHRAGSLNKFGYSVKQNQRGIIKDEIDLMFRNASLSGCFSVVPGHSESSGDPKTAALGRNSTLVSLLLD